MFRLVYNAATGSNNNNWLRRKLLEGKEPMHSALPELPATASAVASHTEARRSADASYDSRNAIKAF